MRTILLIATGGTIASRPTAAGGLAPAITSQELLSCVPDLAEFSRIDCGDRIVFVGKLENAHSRGRVCEIVA